MRHILHDNVLIMFAEYTKQQGQKDKEKAEGEEEEMELEEPELDFAVILRSNNPDIQRTLQHYA